MSDLKTFASMTEADARAFLEAERWPNGPICPHCGTVDEATRMESRKGTENKMRDGLLNCRACDKPFSVTVGTIFEGSHIPLSKWLLGFYLFSSSKKSLSALQLQRQLSLGSYRTAWHMAHRIRFALGNNPNPPMLDGAVEMDESYVGGKPRYRPGRAAKGNTKTRGRGTLKTPVAVLVQRDGEARARVIADVTADTLKTNVRENVERSATLYSDEHTSYRGLGREYAGHHVTRHAAKEYARPGGIHSNTAESYFSLLKRGVVGSFHHVSKHHLDRYLAEFSFRWTHKKTSDAQRTQAALSRVNGVRLYYKQPKRGGEGQSRLVGGAG